MVRHADRNPVPPSTSRPKVVGLSGPIAAGKSVARKAFEALGVACIDVDLVARDIHQNPAHPATLGIAKAFPEWMTQDGALQRGSLRALFARDAAANRILVDLLTPHVLQAVHGWTAAQRYSPYVVWESALFMREDIAMDRTLVVDAPQSLRMERVRHRNPDWSEQDIVNILALQAAWPSRLSDTADTIQNDRSPHLLQEQVLAMHRYYVSLWS